jgi:hypothetical protein
MARLIDERPEDETHENEEIMLEEETQEIEQPQPEDDLPEKYKGKTAAELARMHQEAEKLLGRQSSEVGELRKVVDSYIQTQLTPAAPEEAEEEIDFFSDPDKAMERAIAKHPKIKEAEAVTKQYKQTTAMSQLQAKHPDMQSIVQDEKFAAWIQASKIRTQLFAQADQQYDYDAADELFSLWKERQGAVAQTVAAEKEGRKQAVKSASTGNARGNPDSSSKKIYRRSDIIKLMKTDPERYLSISDEIMQAYAEGRVK